MINPCICSAILGIILLFCGIHFPLYIVKILDPIGDSAIPMAMILIGMQLSEGKITACFKDRQLLAFSIIIMFV
ncbi:MAG: AEC family transporter [Lentihominibacter sp.]